MSTWIAWPPQTREDQFPKDFLQGDPLDIYQNGIDKEPCPGCGFTVYFVSDKDQYEIWNDENHEMISRLLRHQINIGECPDHPKPNWMG